MIHKPLNEIEIGDIQSLIANGVAESRTLDYKAGSLPSKKPSEKKEFLADVCAMANTNGGDLIFGVADQDSVPTDVPGLADFNEDQDLLRLESLVRDGLDPRINGVEFRAIKGGDNGPVLIIRIPQSWLRPHMVSFEGGSRFFARNSKGKYQMDVSEIRTAFLSASVAQEEFRRWRNERIGLIVESAKGKNEQYPLISTDFLLLHVFPLNSAGNVARIQPIDMQANLTSFLSFGGGNESHRFNLEGFMNYSSWRNKEKQLTGNLTSYIQVFRSGRIESAFAELGDRNGEMCIALNWLEKNTLRAVKSMIEGLNKLEVSPPYAVSLSIIGAIGCSMSPSHTNSPISQEKLLLPEVIIEDANADFGRNLRPMFDAMWNVGGFSGSNNYDDLGKWVFPR